MFRHSSHEFVTWSSHLLSSLFPLIQEEQLSVTDESMHTLRRPKPKLRNSAVRLTDRPGMTIAVYRGHKKQHVKTHFAKIGTP